MGEALNVFGRHDPLRGMKFRMSLPAIPSLPSIGFSKISGISQESELIEYREGDEVLVQRKIPGLIKTGEVTFERGVASATALHMLNGRRLAASSAQTGSVDGLPFYRQPVVIDALDRLGQPEWGVRLLRAWPRVIEYGDLDANSSDIWITTITIVYEEMVTRKSVEQLVLQAFRPGS